MEEGGVVNQEEEGQSMGLVFDFFCELCREDGLNVEADGFCVDCEDYLCKKCTDVHRKPRPTRHHEVLSRDSMPKMTPLSPDRISKDISTKCNSHSGKTVEFYCKSHDKIGCSICFVTTHKHCHDIESICDKSENIIDSIEYREFVRGLNDMERKSRDIILKTRENVTTTERNSSKVIDQIRKLREECVAHIDELVLDLITAVDTHASEDKANMDRIEKELSKFSKEVDQLKTEMEILTNSKRVCHLFIQMQMKKSEMSNIEGNLRKMEGENNIRVFRFEPNNKIRNVLKETNIGKLVQARQRIEPNTAIANYSKDIIKIATEHTPDVDISSNNEIDINSIYIPTGSAVMSDTKVVIADNATIKLLDIDTNELISEVGVVGFPFDVAVINKKRVAVTFIDIKKIVLLNVTDKLKLYKEISVRGVCRGVAFTNNKLLVTFNDNPRLELMDMQGNVMKTIDKNTDGSDLFVDPWHICVSNSGDDVYVSDVTANKVVCLTLDGVVKYVYSGLSDPQKICTDHRGYIYVAGSDSKTVHMLTADLKKIQEILTSADGLDKRVLSVSHCQRTDCLYVGMAGSKYIKVYQLKIT